MKTLFIVVTLASTLATAGCYSNSTKESGSTAPEQSTSSLSRSDRY